MQQVSVCLIEEDDLMRDGLKAILNKTGYSPISVYPNIEKFKSAEFSQAFDIVIFGEERPFSDVPKVMEDIKSKLPKARVVVLKYAPCEQTAKACFSCGVDALLSKNIKADAFTAYLKLVDAGERVFPTSCFDMLLKEDGNGRDRSGGVLRDGKSFSSRELDVVQCLTKGQSNKVIARTLDISEATVKVHLKAILRKSGLSNRTQIALWAVDQGIVNPTQEHTGSSFRR